MSISDFKHKTITELHELLGEKRALLREFRFKVQENQLKKVRDIRTVRRDIAQILTVLNAQRTMKNIQSDAAQKSVQK